jgi:hypothetical protein
MLLHPEKSPEKSLEKKLDEWRTKMKEDRVLQFVNEGRSGESRQAAAKELALQRSMKLQMQSSHSNAATKPKISISQRLAAVQQRAAQIEEDRINHMKDVLSGTRAQKIRQKNHKRRQKETIQKSW